jgi:hypothetical protein
MGFVSNLITQDASSIFQAQNRLLQVDRVVGIGEKCLITIFNTLVMRVADETEVRP